MLWRQAIASHSMSPAQQTAATAGRLLYKGAFQIGDPSGRWSSPFDLRIRQPANTGVLDWAGNVLALFERDLPYKLTPELNTAGPSNLSVFKDNDVVLAHYRIAQTRGGEKRLVTLSPGMAGLDADCKIIEIDEEGNKVCYSVMMLHLDSWEQGS